VFRYETCFDIFFLYYQHVALQIEFRSIFKNLNKNARISDELSDS